jgi:hypothetical protein
MRWTTVLLMLVAVVPGADAALPLAQALREEVKVEERVLALAIGEVGQAEEQIQGAWVRVERQSADLLRAQEQGESLDSIRLREADLRAAESELMMHIRHSQQLRREMIAGRLRIAELQAEVERLESTVGSSDDPVSGPWRLVVEPGGQEGYMSLVLDGTLVQGTYQLAGGWTGSLRGTLVAGKLRLERIDSQIGFSSVFYARLIGSGEEARLEGTWDATQLATGMPSSGSWVAERVRELPP